MPVLMTFLYRQHALFNITYKKQKPAATQFEEIDCYHAQLSAYNTDNKSTHTTVKYLSLLLCTLLVLQGSGRKTTSHAKCV